MQKSDGMIEKVAKWHEEGNLSGLIKASKYQSKPPNGGDIVIRATAIMGLGEIGNKRAIKALKAALKDSDGMVRFSAANELFKLRIPNLMELLQKTFSRDEYLRCLAFIKSMEKH